MYSFIACPFCKGNWPTSPCFLRYNFGSKHQFSQGMGNRCMSLSFGWLGGKYTWDLFSRSRRRLGRPFFVIILILFLHSIIILRSNISAFLFHAACRAFCFNFFGFGWPVCGLPAILESQTSLALGDGNIKKRRSEKECGCIMPDQNEGRVPWCNVDYELLFCKK